MPTPHTPVARSSNFGRTLQQLAANSQQQFHSSKFIRSSNSIQSSNSRHGCSLAIYIRMMRGEARRTQGERKEKARRRQGERKEGEGKPGERKEGLSRGRDIRDKYPRKLRLSSSSSLSSSPTPSPSARRAPPHWLGRCPRPAGHPYPFRTPAPPRQGPATSGAPGCAPQPRHAFRV